MKKIFDIIGFVLLVILSVVVTAFTVQVMWGWFIVPLGVKAIGMSHAYGITLIIGLLSMPVVTALLNRVSEEFKRLGNVAQIGGTIVATLLFLLIGFITVQFM